MPKGHPCGHKIEIPGLAKYTIITGPSSEPLCYFKHFATRCHGDLTGLLPLLFTGGCCFNYQANREFPNHLNYIDDSCQK